LAAIFLRDRQRNLGLVTLETDWKKERNIMKKALKKRREGDTNFSVYLRQALVSTVFAIFSTKLLGLGGAE